MATRDELIGALTKADAAGDTESANIFASKIKQMDAVPAQPRSELSTFRALEHADPGTDTYARAAAAVKPQPGIPAATADLNETPMAAPTPEENAFNDRVKREKQKMLREGDPTKGTQLRLPDWAGGANIPLTEDVGKFLVGNTQQATDAMLATRQFANAATGGLIGDKAALAKEAAEKAAADAPLLRTGAGKAGAFIGRVVPEFAAMYTGGPLLPITERALGAAGKFLPEPVLAAGRAVGSKVGDVGRAVGNKVGDVGRAVGDRVGDVVNKIVPGAYELSTGAARKVGGVIADVSPNAAEFAADVATRAVPKLPPGTITQAAKTAISEGRGMLPKSVVTIIDSAAKQGAVNAGLQQLNPSADYDIGENAKVGAMFGAGGDLAGRLVGRVISPSRRFSSGEMQPIPGNPYSTERVPTAATQRATDIKTLQEAKLLPNVLTAHLGNNKVLDAATAAMAKVPIFGRGIAKALDENSVALTKRQAIEAGLDEGRAAVTPDASQMAQRLREISDTKAASFRNLETPVPMDVVHPRLQAAHDDIVRHAAAVSRDEAAAKVGRAADAVAPKATPAAAAAAAPATAAEATPLRQTIEDAMTDSLAESAATRAGTAAGATTPQTRTIAELMNLRNAASKLVKGESDGTIRRAYQEMRDTYTDAIERALPEEERGGFREWLKEYGDLKDFARAADKSGGVSLDPRKTLKAYVPEALDRVAPPEGSTAELLATLNRVNPNLSNAGIATPWGRVAGMVGQSTPYLALGGSIAHQALSDKGDPLTAAVDLGAGASAAAMMSLLLGPKGAKYIRGQYGVQSPAALEALRKALSVGALEEHQIRKDKR